MDQLKILASNAVKCRITNFFFFLKNLIFFFNILYLSTIYELNKCPINSIVISLINVHVLIRICNEKKHQ